MEHPQFLFANNRKTATMRTAVGAPAIGIFGFSIGSSRVHTFKPITNYIREMEQMPNFSPPSIEKFVGNYMTAHNQKSRNQA